MVNKTRRQARPAGPGDIFGRDRKRSEDLRNIGDTCPCPFRFAHFTFAGERRAEMPRRPAGRLDSCAQDSNQVKTVALIRTRRGCGDLGLLTVAWTPRLRGLPQPSCEERELANPGIGTSSFVDRPRTLNGQSHLNPIPATTEFI